MNRKLIGVLTATACLLGSAGVAAAVAAHNRPVDIRTDGSDAALRCPGGMARLSHVLDQNAPIFPGDPVPEITQWSSIPVEGFLLERMSIGTHTGTHLSAPGHFIEGATTVDQLPASDFAWPAYVIDVRARVAQDPDFQLSATEIRTYERAVGRIPHGALVILLTGFEDRWPTQAYSETAPGISAAAIEWLFSARRIKGVGSDTFGPDATSDTGFAASTAVFSHGGVTIENMNGIDQLHSRGDIVIAPTVRLVNGSGYQNDPLGCLRSAVGRDGDD